MIPKIHGYVFQSRRGSWSYEVSVDGEVYLTDNTGNWRKIYDSCMRDVEALTRIYVAGHRLTKTWYDLLEEAIEDF